ncbi:uncharacterized protein YidB (DUF937 family) [Enterovirga rhinocerotis]|uniref:Uncharacterized protein YidB (DUF937 family) n=2 Tax=Enterovirga rhinocerotis TaxID=1339210 RepID=A0A4R7BW71_9HYPH|nr:uncharacterized protein YidB (DUF937 family) [Enterovirga rhinocerotis]
MGLLDNILGSKDGGSTSPLTKILLALLAAKAASSYFGKDDASAAKAEAAPAPDQSGTIQSGILAGFPSLESIAGSIFGRGDAPAQNAPGSSPEPAGSGTIQSGVLAGLPSLDSLLDRFRGGGLGDKVDSWVGPGENKPVAPTELNSVLDERTLGELEKATGLPRDQLLQQLSSVLPQAISKLSSGGSGTR